MELGQKVRSDIAGIVSARAGIPRKKAEALLERPPQIIDADLSFPCFILAKKKKKNPAEIAKDIASKIKPRGFVRLAVAMGPYVNFHLDWKRLGGELLKKVLKEKEKYGHLKAGKEKVMVEFFHLNTHKAFHIGHVRNIITGESLSRILEFSGKKVIRANYQGDIGPHVAKCLWGFLKTHKGKAPSKNQGLFLGEVYAKANQKARDNEKIQKEIREINKSLYAGDPKLMPVWKKTRQWSLDYFDSVYKEFSTHFDRFYFESEMEGPGKKLAQDLLKKKIAKKSEGAIVIDLKKEGLGVLVLITGDGTPLYHIKDFILARIQAKESPSSIIHVVGSEQSLYFRQLFKALESISPAIAKKERHLSYGLVNLPSGKMSSRTGTIITYEDLREKLLEKSLSETKKRNKKASKKTLEETSRTVMMGALKYDMIKTSPEKVIVFDWDRALSLQGNTGPYLQYTHARACSILRKAKAKKIPKFDPSLLTDKEEKALLRILLRFSESVAASERDLRPHYIANYAYDLATRFNEFYETLPVIKAEKKIMNARLALTECVRIALKNSLNLLGINAPERM
jgi:arginyl-tRNA synthetase